MYIASDAEFGLLEWPAGFLRFASVLGRGYAQFFLNVGLVEFAVVTFGAELTQRARHVALGCFVRP